MKTLRKRKINPVKILRMVCVTLVVISAMTAAVKTSADGSTEDSYRVVTVCRGDTLWNIAKQHKTDQNIQEYICEIMELNSLEKSDIAPGQKLKIPLNY